MQHERTIGGLSCSQVLAQLSDYIDGKLMADTQARMVTHVSGCDNCERFGGVVAQTVQALRKLGGGPPPASSDELLAQLQGKLG